MQNTFDTQYFKVITETENKVTNILVDVYGSLLEKGYEPINQMVGYIMSGDPTYITSYDNSRGKITRINRDEIVEELLRSFVEHHQLEQKNKGNTNENSGC